MLPAMVACAPVGRAAGPVGVTLAPPMGDLEEFDADLRRAKELGVDWVRFSVVAEELVESWSDSGTVRFKAEGLDMYRRAFDLVDSHKLQVCLMTVESAPLIGDAEDYLDQMGQYWAKIAAEYGSSIRMWQVFNEADGLDFRTAKGIEEPVEDYYEDLAQALAVAATTIHRHAPGAAVTTNANGYPVDDSTEQRWHQFFSVIGKYLDVLTVNAYPVLSEPSISSLPERLIRLSEAFDKPIAVGEFGLQTGPKLYTENQQAESVTKTIEALMDSPADPAFVYRLRNDGAHEDDGFGLYTMAGTPKSSLAEIAVIINRANSER